MKTVWTLAARPLGRARLRAAMRSLTMCAMVAYMAAAPVARLLVTVHAQDYDSREWKNVDDRLGRLEGFHDQATERIARLEEGEAARDTVIKVFGVPVLLLFGKELLDYLLARRKAN